jgi:hypothetical protein
MVTMHGFFDLQDEPSEPEIQRAFDDFVSHLNECELISSHKVMRRSPNENYDSNRPSTKYYIGMDFEHLANAQECWHYIERNEGVCALHHIQVHSKIRDYSFFLAEDIGT